MIRCLHCGAETSNGLALCELCQRKAGLIFEMLPLYFRNLARWRPGRAGTRDVPGSRPPQGPSTTVPDRVSRALDEAGNALTTWARLLEDARHIAAPTRDSEVDQMTALCEWFAEHLTSISTLDWCGELISNHHDEDGDERDGLGYHEARLRRLTEQVAPGWYAGSCRQCGAPTFVVPGFTWVTCNGIIGWTESEKPIHCGATFYAADRLGVVLEEARDWQARPKTIAEALVALVDGEQSVPRLYDRIRKWESLGWLAGTRKTDADGDPMGAKLYRLGDVYDLAAGHAGAPTRASRSVS